MFRIFNSQTFGLLFSICLFLSQSLIAENLVVNGGFENGVGANFDVNQSIDNWILTGSTGRIDAVGSPPTLAGSHSAAFSYGNLPCNGTLSQTVSTEIGQAYSFEFLYGVNGNVRNHVLGVQLDGLAGTGSLLDTTLIATANGPLTFSAMFIADSATTTLRFSDSPANDTFQSDLILDSVYIFAVPEIATILGSYVYHGIYSGTGSSIDADKVLAKESDDPQLLS